MLLKAPPLGTLRGGINQVLKSTQDQGQSSRTSTAQRSRPAYKAIHVAKFPP